MVHIHSSGKKEKKNTVVPREAESRFPEMDPSLDELGRSPNRVGNRPVDPIKSSPVKPKPIKSKSSQSESMNQWEIPIVTPFWGREEFR
mmetsp:Transcript_39518/g.82069  ORF Transcript_39518/g.82069 Transcript_39518/m.82069 type:complete len:89 (-) Transcript_39518:319-585(-)